MSALYKLVDLDGARGFQRDLLEFLLGHLDELVLLQLVALDDILVGHLVAGVGVHLEILDAVAGLPVELVEADLLALRGRRIERHRAGDQGQTQKAFPVGARGHVRRTPVRSARIQDERRRPVPTYPTAVPEILQRPLLRHWNLGEVLLTLWDETGT
jgi:hypothetical protein